MTKPLSPAAQAVIDAMSNVCAMNCPTAPALAASIIRAVADHVAPEGYAWSHRQAIRAEILAITAEMEAVDA